MKLSTAALFLMTLLVVVSVAVVESWCNRNVCQIECQRQGLEGLCRLRRCTCYKETT